MIWTMNSDYEIMELHAFKDYRVFVVYGDGVFGVDKLLQYLGMDIRISSVRAYTFNEGESFVALVLVPEGDGNGKGN